MGDFVKEMLREIPRFLTDFVSALASPISFARARVENGTESVTARASGYLAISVAVTTLIRAPMMKPPANFGIRLASYAIWVVAVVLVVSAIVGIAWRAVGGTLRYLQYVMIDSYFFGVLLVLTHTVALVTHGLCSVPYGQHIGAFFIACALCVLGVWCAVCWNALQQLNCLSAKQAVIALLITGIACVPAYVILMALQLQLLGLSIQELSPVALTHQRLSCRGP